MKPTILILATALVLGLTPPAQARPDDDQVAFGMMVAAALLGLTIAMSKDDEPKAVVTQPTGKRHNVPKSRPHRAKLLPSDCLRRVQTLHGPARLFGNRCMKNTYAHYNRLPAKCFDRVQTRSGKMRRGFRARCLRRSGFTWH